MGGMTVDQLRLALQRTIWLQSWKRDDVEVQRILKEYEYLVPLEVMRRWTDVEAQAAEWYCGMLAMRDRGHIGLPELPLPACLVGYRIV